MEVKAIWLILFEEPMRNCLMPTVSWHIFTYHLEVVTGTVWHICGNDSLLRIESSRWKGSVTCGLEADISLAPCLATDIWTLVPKAITGPKSRGTSFNTTLWRHVQRYCAHFPLFMQIMCSGYSFLHRRKFPRTNLFYTFKQLKITIFPYFQNCVISRVFVVIVFLLFFFLPFFSLMKWFSSSLIST